MEQVQKEIDDLWEAGKKRTQILEIHTEQIITLQSQVQLLSNLLQTVIKHTIRGRHTDVNEILNNLLNKPEE